MECFGFIIENKFFDLIRQSWRSKDNLYIFSVCSWYTYKQELGHKMKFMLQTHSQFFKFT